MGITLPIEYVPFDVPTSSFCSFSVPSTTAATDNLAAQLRAGPVLIGVARHLQGVVDRSSTTPLTAEQDIANREIGLLMELGAKPVDEAEVDLLRKVWR